MASIDVKSKDQPYLVKRGAGYYEYQLPISVKAVISLDGLVPLLMNERDEWELPGGKLDLGESPISCVERECMEELGIEVHVGNCVSSWVYQIFADRHVLIVTYLARALAGSIPSFSHEHKKLALVHPSDVFGLQMPEGYKLAVQEALKADWFGA